MMRILVIAECGSCHDGELAKAFRLIEAAKAAGADVAKFQFWSSPERLAAQRHADAYLEAYRRYQVPAEWLPQLKAHCDQVGIAFGSTTNLPEDVSIVAPYVDLFKVSSFEADVLRLLQQHECYDQPVVISLGMSDEDDLDMIRRWRAAEWTRWVREIRLLHCVSAYPAPVEELNLGFIRQHELDGFSDHSGGTDTGLAAVCAGARVIEVHLKLPDTHPANPDAGPFALLPEHLALYVQGIRRAETMLGDGYKRVMPCEQAMLRYKVRA